jgi:DNA-binding NarL/FixJ family response regulator
VAEAATGSAAIREAVLHHPDVVVMDLQMPDLNGIEAARELRRVLPSAAVLVLTYFATPPKTPTPAPATRAWVIPELSPI